MAIQAALIAGTGSPATQGVAGRFAVGPAYQTAGWSTLATDAFIAEWDELARSAVEPNPFCESWYLLSALRQFDTPGDVSLFLLRQGDHLVGLMPFAPLSRYGNRPVPNVQNWLHYNAFHGAPLVRAGQEEAFWRAYLAFLDGEGGQSLFAHFNGLTVGGSLAVALEHVCAKEGRAIGLVRSEERAFLQSDQTPDIYFEAAVRGKKRKELRRQKNRLSEDGALTFARYDDDHGLDAWIDEFLALERAGWKGESGSALDCSDETRNLFREALNGAAAQGRLERLDLRLDGKPLAMLVNFICPPGSFSFKTAFDEQYARFSPGVLLQIENLALLDRRDVDWCDSCAAEGHPMIDSLWVDRRIVGRYSVAIGGAIRRTIFSTLLRAELARGSKRKAVAKPETPEDDA